VAREATNAEEELRAKLSDVMYDLWLLRAVYMEVEPKDSLKSDWIDLKW
jgi:hypothetical protein